MENKSKGKAVERIYALLDERSFVEIGQAVTARGSSAIIRYYCYIPYTSTLLQATACHTFHTLYVLSFLICY